MPDEANIAVFIPKTIGVNELAPNPKSAVVPGLKHCGRFGKNLGDVLRVWSHAGSVRPTLLLPCRCECIAAKASNLAIEHIA